MKVGGKTVNAANPYLGRDRRPDDGRLELLEPADGATRREARRGAEGRGSDAVRLRRAGAGRRRSAPTTPRRTPSRSPSSASAKGKKNAVRVLGELSPPAIATDDIETEEDQGSIPLATDTGIPATTDGVTVSSEIGDGPHGSAGTGNGDFDFYELSATAGQVLRADTMGSELDTLLVRLRRDRHDRRGQRRRRRHAPERAAPTTIPADGDYYVMVSGFTFFGGIPEDPFDSASGTGVRRRGDLRPDHDGRSGRPRLLRGAAAAG